MPLPIPENKNVRRRPNQIQNTILPRPPIPRPVPPPPHRPQPPQVSRGVPQTHNRFATVVGVILYCMLDYGSSFLFIHSPALVNRVWCTLQLNHHSFPITLGTFLAALPFVIPLFFGAAFSPWVGLIVGGSGCFIGDYIIAQAFGYPFSWNWCLGMGVMGFLASLAPFRTRIRRGCFFTLITSLIVGVLAIGIGIGLTAYSITRSMNEYIATALFYGYASTIALAVLLLWITLLLYNRIVSNP